eukprot:scaffold49650_cov17-Tisochrysis_lutea.AAC.4
MLLTLILCAGLVSKQLSLPQGVIQLSVSVAHLQEQPRAFPACAHVHKYACKQTPNNARDALTSAFDKLVSRMRTTHVVLVRGSR